MTTRSAKDALPALSRWKIRPAILHRPFLLDAPRTEWPYEDDLPESEGTVPATRPLPPALQSAWNAFRSLKMGIFLLALIGLACVYGTMFFAGNSALGDSAIPQAKARVFNAWWFCLLLAIFFVQFVISTWHVTKMSIGLWWRRDFSRSKSFLTTGKGRASIAVPGGPEHIEEVLGERFTRAHHEGTRFFAHAGLRQRIGPTIIHAGIVIILLAGLARFALYKNGHIVSDGRFVGDEGETSNVLFLPVRDDEAMSSSNSRAIQLPVQIKVHDFDEVLSANSRNPAYYSSLIEVTDPRTGDTDVFKLDMNHGARIAGFDFHQAGYSALPPIQTHRTDFDVRDAATGERIAVTDGSADTRVQVGDEDLFLEVDGESPGGAWRLYTSASPAKPIAEGKLLTPSRKRTLSVSVRNFYPQVDFKPGSGLSTLSNNPVDPALEIDVIVDGMPQGRTFLFQDPEKQALVPPLVPGVDLKLADVRARQESKEWNFDNFDWKNPSNAFFEVAVVDHDTSTTLATATTAFTVPSEPVAIGGLKSDPPPGGARYAVYPLQRSMRYRTILSVVREPVVPYYCFGVALMAIGAILTFSGRYRAFYGMWEPEGRTLHFALIPRFGSAPDPKEFASLTEALAGGAPNSDTSRGAANPAQTPEPAHAP